MRPFYSLTAALLIIGGVAQAQGPSNSRDLTVEQNAAFNAGEPRAGSLQLSAWVDRKDATYARGDAIRLHVKANEKIYLKIFNVGPENPAHVTQLFPNKFQNDDLIPANRTVEIAGRKNHSQITVSKTEPVGTELIKVIASTRPFPKLVPATALLVEGPFFVVKGGVPELVRDLQITSDEPMPADDKLAVINLKIRTVEAH